MYASKLVEASLRMRDVLTTMKWYPGDRRCRIDAGLVHGTSSSSWRGVVPRMGHVPVPVDMACNTLDSQRKSVAIAF